MTDVLILGHGIGLDADLRWVDVMHNAGLFDVVDGATGEKLRTAPRDVLLSLPFEKLFGNDFSTPTLAKIYDVKIYKSGDVFMCDFIANDVAHTGLLMTDNAFFIDGYEINSAVAVIHKDTVSAIAMRNNVVYNIDLSVPKRYEQTPERMSEIQKRMAEIYDVVTEYNNLKSELVALIKDSNTDIKRVYDGAHFKITYTPAGIRRTIDMDRMKSAGIYEMYIKESPTTPIVRIVKI